MDLATFLRVSLEGPLPEVLPWQEAIYRSDPLVPLRMVSARGAPAEHRSARSAAMVSAIAMTLGMGETVEVFAASNADAEEMMSEARKLLRQIANERGRESS